jgi:5S rRNA maturation endonuclease (ribonuclease M5)
MYADELLSGSDDEFIRDNHSLYPLNSKTMHMLGLTEPVWRTFPFKFLSDIIGARVIEVHYERNSICYVYLPVMINGSLKGYVKALPEKPTEKGKTSYLNARGSWSSTCGLLGYDSAMQLCQEQNVSTVVLVEGPRDALRLLQHDIPAMAILGTQTWSSAKVSMLALSGVQNVIICTDGDNAGTAASKMLYYGVRTEKDGRVSECATPLKDVFNTSVFSLKPYKKNPEDDKEKIDPCAAPEQAFVDLKECIS